MRIFSALFAGSLAILLCLSVGFAKADGGARLTAFKVGPAFEYGTHWIRMNYVAEFDNETSGRLRGYVCVSAFDKEGFEIENSISRGFNTARSGSDNDTGYLTIDQKVWPEVTRITGFITEAGCLFGKAKAISEIRTIIIPPGIGSASTSSDIAQADLKRAAEMEAYRRLVAPASNPPRPLGKGLQERGPQVASAIPAQPDIPYAFNRGIGERTLWEQWLAGLTGDYRDGAFWWSGQRSLAKPGSCDEPGHSADWAAGCGAARERLASSDISRKADPEYRRGWNSYSRAQAQQ